MAESGLICSESECKKRLTDVKNMSYSELEQYNVKCCDCGSWILKDNDIANQTYHAISNKWAEEFMNQQMRRK